MGNKKRTFTKEFKEQAVLLSESNERLLSEIACAEAFRAITSGKISPVDALNAVKKLVLVL
jgi:hypothetical protein